MAASLPIDRPISVEELLGRHVELGATATRRDVELLATKNPCPPHRAHLEALAKDRYEVEVLGKRVTVLELLEQFSSCALTFAELLELLPAMRVRQYSISSSPRRDPARCALTVAVVDAPAWSGNGRFRGACSSYLARLAPNEQVAVTVRRPNQPFRPPADNSAPMILIGAGTGIAPLRGFIEDRALREGPGETLLFFGCDHPEVDFLYRDELPSFVEVFPAFFRKPEGEIAFVQHRLWAERARVHALIESGAYVFLCGDGARMAPAVREVLLSLRRTEASTNEHDAREWLAQIELDGRFVSDVFG
jgi:cytochrome P450/NADPH-cytochrome P450 reductase